MVHPLTLVDTPPVAHALPQNVEAEAALLGALMIDNRIVEDIQLKLRPEHFFEPTHGRVYEQILRLVDRNMIANPVTLRPQFEADEDMKELGGPGYLAQLTGSAAAAIIGARDFAEQIFELAQLRALIVVGRQLVEKALDTSETIDPKDQIEQAESALYRVAEEGGSEGTVKSFPGAAALAVKLAARAVNSGGHLSGITTGLADLNDLIGGLHESDLVILAARPGMGKTALATNIAVAAAKRWVRDQEDGIEPDKSVGAVVAFFSLEMSSDQLATRILAEQSEIRSERIRTGYITQQEFNKFARAAADLETLPLYIDDTPALTIAALRTRARRLKRQRSVGMIVVDYLQLLQGAGRNTNDNRVQEISEISRGLKTLAKELNVPVLALSQLSRQVESREDKKPQLSDLRESGSIEQDADIVMFIYREDYYHGFKRPTPVTNESSTEEIAKSDEWLKKNEEIGGKAQIIVGKSRHGRTDTITVKFDHEFTKFSDLARSEGYP